MLLQLLSLTLRLQLRSHLMTRLQTHLRSHLKLLYLPPSLCILPKQAVMPNLMPIKFFSSYIFSSVVFLYTMYRLKTFFCQSFILSMFIVFSYNLLSYSLVRVLGTSHKYFLYYLYKDDQNSYSDKHDICLISVITVVDGNSTESSAACKSGHCRIT